MIAVVATDRSGAKRLRRATTSVHRRRSLRYLERAVPPPLLVTGDIEQHVELAEYIGALKAERDRIDINLDVAKGVLRAMLTLRPKPVRSVTTPNYRLSLKPETAGRCVDHNVAAEACHYLHSDTSSVTVVVQPTGHLYWSISSRLSDAAAPTASDSSRIRHG